MTLRALLPLAFSAALMAATANAQVASVNTPQDQPYAAVNAAIANINNCLFANGCPNAKLTIPFSGSVGAFTSLNVGSGAMTVDASGNATIPVLTGPASASGNVLVKQGLYGPVVAQLGGGADSGILMYSPIQLPNTFTVSAGGFNVAPIFQNSTVSGSCTTCAAFAFGAFLQQTYTGNWTSSPGYLTGFTEHLIVNGNNTGTAGAVAGYFSMDVTQTSSPSNGFVALTTSCNIYFTSAAPGHACWGFNPTASMGPGITAASLTGDETDLLAGAGATLTQSRIGYLLVETSPNGNLTVTGADDMGFVIDKAFAPTSTDGFTYGVSIGRNGGNFPLKTTGTMIFAEAHLGGTFNIGNGIDWHLGTASGNWEQFGSVYTLDGAGNEVETSIQLSPTTVATLPTCAAGLAGRQRYVTDATAPSYNASLTGGSNVGRYVTCTSSGGTYAWRS